MTPIIQLTVFRPPKWGYIDVATNVRIWGDGKNRWKVEMKGRQVDFCEGAFEFKVEEGGEIKNILCENIRGPVVPPITRSRFNNLNGLNGVNFPIKVKGEGGFKVVEVDTGEVKNVNFKNDRIEGLEKFKDDDDEIDLDDLDSSSSSSSSSSPSTPPPFDTSTPRLTFLGTGSSKPHSLRGPSSILLSGSLYTVLLDCGETAPTNLNLLNVKRVDLIYITHKHLDHYGGVVPLLDGVKCSCGGKRKKCECGNIVVVADEWMHDYIERILGTVQGVREGFRVYWKVLVKDGRVYDYPVEARGILNYLDFKLFPTEHCYDSTGCRLNYGNKDISYSGDTRKCSTVINAVRGCDVLIHEATFKGDMIEDAKGKRHSTDVEAKEVGEEAGVGVLIMTHFSQRYGVRGGAVDGLSLRIDGIEGEWKRVEEWLEGWKDSRGVKKDGVRDDDDDDDDMDDEKINTNV
ncbi:hypothetical protein TrVE_jg14291 [Triparma verrucosa]|uniref:ribonuclease Z n=1 Tax=Triparma verrucosa TaxID=1606542 RepID=A0A9W7F3X7_9STRA|nr:hypothetical protein TrVE_jg14291 [Triparma verrucosa]